MKVDNFQLLREYDNGYCGLHPWPTFINQHTRKQIENTAISLANLIASLPQRLFSNDPREISRYYKFKEDDVMYFLLGYLEDHMKNLFSRGDFILSPSGLKCLEYNIAANLGGWDMPLWHSLYLQNPIIAEFIREYDVNVAKENNLVSSLFRSVIDTGLKKLPASGKEMNIAIVEEGKKNPLEWSDKESYVARTYKNLLQERYKGLEGETIICDYPHLETKRGGVFFRDKKIHAIIEYSTKYTPLVLLTAFQMGDVLLYNGSISTLVSNKLNLALLSEYKDSRYFSPEEKKIIETHVPWTRKISDCQTRYQDETVNLPDFIRSNRENLVIKPADGLGGEKVYVGMYTSQVQWEKALAEALNQGNWLVQEYIKPVSMLYQDGRDSCCLHDTVWGIFTFGSHYGGGFLRVMPEKNGNGVINCLQGATPSLLIEVEE